jgi:tRNA threonylcarbamoyladenosine dehydratase
LIFAIFFSPFLLATDAIDNINTQVELLAHCVQNNIKVFSSMGAGTKSDPTRIQIADLSATHYDPLARAVRQHLRAVLSRSERSSPPTPPSSDPSSSADADADDDPSSAPSPASSTREYSIPVVYSSEVPSDDVAAGQL